MEKLFGIEMNVLAGDKIISEDVPLRTAMNEVLRDAYIEDNENGVSKWNKTLKELG